MDHDMIFVYSSLSLYPCERLICVVALRVIVSEISEGDNQKKAPNYANDDQNTDADEEIVRVVVPPGHIHFESSENKIRLKKLGNDPENPVARVFPPAPAPRLPSCPACPAVACPLARVASRLGSCSPSHSTAQLPPCRIVSPAASTGFRYRRSSAYCCFRRLPLSSVASAGFRCCVVRWR
ncbi:hypothetical protein M5K25_008393 [Dendrobium thyrsiflorum]|uniref:Uncharacterized protein n=1 Tax=Dendrobium thyrsiflorum TaxID=117978 RepID=A0ABD0V9D8_DENTH